MVYLILIAATFLLLAGFLALTRYETARGLRVFARERSRLDGTVEQIEFILAHVDLAKFLRDELRRLAEIVGHSIAQLSLELVRAVERLLTRLVRYFRTRRSETDLAPRESVREFVKTLSDFKDQLDETRPAREQESSEQL